MVKKFCRRYQLCITGADLTGTRASLDDEWFLMRFIYGFHPTFQRVLPMNCSLTSTQCRLQKTPKKAQLFPLLPPVYHPKPKKKTLFKGGLQSLRNPIPKQPTPPVSGLQRHCRISLRRLQLHQVLPLVQQRVLGLEVLGALLGEPNGCGKEEGPAWNNRFYGRTFATFGFFEGFVDMFKGFFEGHIALFLSHSHLVYPRGGLGV